MPYDPAIHHRRSIRLRDYDYSQDGAYFVTICVQGKAHLFGAVRDCEVHPNDAGAMIEHWWSVLPNKFPSMITDVFVVMPNHVHGIIVINGEHNEGEHTGSPLRNDSNAVRPNELWDAGAHAGAPLHHADAAVRADQCVRPNEHAAVRADHCVRPNELWDAGAHAGAPLHHADAAVRADQCVRPNEHAAVRADHCVRPTLGTIMQWFKTMTTNAYIRGVRELGWLQFEGWLWQRNYYERIIRNDNDLDAIRAYIVNNPARWQHK